MSHPPSEPTTTTVVPVFAALGDSTRLALLDRLSNGQSQSITQLTRGMGLSRQGVRKHLAILEQARLVTSKRVGRESRFACQSGTLIEARRYLDRAAQQWDDAIERLKKSVEK